jgi:5,10-methylenetetrahydrofolate reductase
MSFLKRLTAKEFVVLAEMHTPKGVDISRLVNDGRRLKGRVDAVLVPDMDNGIMRLTALAGGVLLQQQGLEAIIAVYCRDKNRMALQGDLLAAHVLGVQNLVVVPSADMAQSDHREAKPVFDLDEVGLLGAIHTLQEGKDLGGADLDGRPFFNTGCALASLAEGAPFDEAFEAVKHQLEAGATFVITPPVFDVEACGGALKKLGGLGVPIIGAVFLIKSVAVARYLARNDPGAHVSDALIQRIKQAADREAEAVKIAGETVRALQGVTQGMLLQTHGWEHRLPAILDMAGL